MPTCQHCHAEISSYHTRKHARCCPDSPAVHAAITAAITDPDDPTRAVNTKVYANRKVSCGAPAVSVLLNRYGPWSDVCEAFGLLPPVSMRGYVATPRNYAQPVECPHCRRPYGRKVIAQHSAVCPERADMRAAIIAIASHSVLPGVAVSQEEYAERQAGTNLPGANTLEKHFVTWYKAMAFYGLRRVRQTELAELLAMAEVKAAEEEARRIIREEEMGAYGLPVAKIKPEEVLRVNGRECVRLELR